MGFNASQTSSQNIDLSISVDLSLQSPVDREEACLDPRGVITKYQISFQTATIVTTESVNIARCTFGRCRHTFKPPSNALLTYDSVAVAGENMMGVGVARTCTTQTISELR